MAATATATQSLHDAVPTAHGHFDRGNNLAAAGLYPRAETEYRQGLAQLPPGNERQQSHLQYNLGAALENQGRKQKSILEYQRQIDLLPPNDPIVDVLLELI